MRERKTGCCWAVSEASTPTAIAQTRRMSLAVRSADCFTSSTLFAAFASKAALFGAGVQKYTACIPGTSRYRGVESSSHRGVGHSEAFGHSGYSTRCRKHRVVIRSMEWTRGTRGACRTRRTCGASKRTGVGHTRPRNADVDSKNDILEFLPVGTRSVAQTYRWCTIGILFARPCASPSKPR